ncbi:MAG TPA: hypothetical protein VLI54_00060 [Bacillota bacterium]|nr:hypothetical protein [Bacillota bacterium]
MARLPIPGSDDGVWGAILNDFLAVELENDGRLKLRTDGTLSSFYVRPGSGIPASDLTASAQTQLAQAASAYQKPSAGIPAADLAGAAQLSLSTADSAVQSVNGKSGTSVMLSAGDIGAPTQLAQMTDVNANGASDQQVLVYNGTAHQWSAGTVSSTTVSDASNTSKGIIQLAGDLAGSNDPSSPAITAGAIRNAHIAANAAIAVAKISGLGSAAIRDVGMANGVAGLDGSGKVPAAQLPAVGTSQIVALAVAL